MWIRNQKKDIMADYEFIFAKEQEIRGIPRHPDLTYEILGLYKSKSRTLEVLDFIQLSIANNNKTLTMPQE